MPRRAATISGERSVTSATRPEERALPASPPLEMGELGPPRRGGGLPRRLPGNRGGGGAAAAAERPPRRGAPQREHRLHQRGARQVALRPQLLDERLERQ